MAQKESAGEAKASAGSPVSEGSPGSPVPDSSAFDLDSPTQTDSTTPQQHAVDLRLMIPVIAFAKIFRCSSDET